MSARGRFQTRLAFGGAGFASDYTQTVDGETTLHCVSVFRFGADGSAEMIWIPPVGEPQHFRGASQQHKVRLERTDDQGMTHTMLADYSREGELVQSMSVRGPDGVSFEVLSASYRREV
ncbi:MAG: hypothetical protein AAFX85_20875 [Pseudomonadota bacterium]